MLFGFVTLISAGLVLARILYVCVKIHLINTNKLISNAIYQMTMVEFGGLGVIWFKNKLCMDCNIGISYARVNNAGDVMKKLFLSNV